MISLKLSKDYNLLAFSFLCAPAASSSINCILNPPSWVLVLCLQISRGLKGSISPQIPLKHAEYQPRKAPWQNPCLSFTYVVHTYIHVCDAAGGGQSAEVDIHTAVSRATRTRAGSLSFPERNEDPDLGSPAGFGPAQPHQVGGK